MATHLTWPSTASICHSITVSQIPNTIFHNIFLIVPTIRLSYIKVILIIRFNIKVIVTKMACDIRLVSVTRVKA